MICHYLSIYSSSEFLWQVASCSARQENYIPSITDLEHLCRKDHSRCPFFASTNKQLNANKMEIALSPSPSC